jgi:hypothetical protein
MIERFDSSLSKYSATIMTKLVSRITSEVKEFNGKNTLIISKCFSAVELLLGVSEVTGEYFGSIEVILDGLFRLIEVKNVECDDYLLEILMSLTSKIESHIDCFNFMARHFRSIYY